MKKIAIAFGAAVLSCILLLFAVDCIPQSLVKKNIEKSAQYFKEQPLFGRVWEKYAFTTYDNYADVILTNIIYSMDNTKPLESSIKASYFDEYMVEVNDNLYKAVQQDVEPSVDYFRYWHGSMVYLRPLYIFFSITGVRVVLMLVWAGMLIATGILLWKKGFHTPAWILPVSMILMQSWMCVRSIEYINAFLVMQAFLLAIALDIKKDQIIDANRYLPWFAISGVVTCFVDFLTTETVSLSMPLLLLYLLKKEKGTFGTWKKEMQYGFACMFTWGISYAVMFLLKWGISALTLGPEAFSSAFSEATTRVAGEVTDNNTNLGRVLSTGEQLLGTLWKNLQALFCLPDDLSPNQIFGVAFGVMIVVFVIWYLFRKEKSTGAFQGVILLLGLLPYVRFLTLRNHSFIHFFFTYRAQVVTVAVVIAFLWYGLQGKSNGKKRRKR